MAYSDSDPCTKCSWNKDCLLTGDCDERKLFLTQYFNYEGVSK